MKERKALLVVDMQNDFVFGALAVRGADKILTPVYDKIMQAYHYNWHIIYSKDWHPYTHLSFDINGGPWPIHCLQDSWGAKIVDIVNFALVSTNAVEIKKGENPTEEQYSALTPALKKYLDDNKIDSLEVCGLAGDYCVKETIKDLKNDGYWVRKLDDLVRNVNG